jgi:signal transduction histidine kinase
LVYGLISVLVVTAMGLGIYYLSARYLNDRARDDLAALAGFYAAYTAATAADEAQLRGLAPQIVAFFAPQAGHEVRIFSAANGTLLAATRDIGLLPSHAALAEASFGRRTLFLSSSYDQPERLYVARTVMGADGTPLAVVEVSRDIRQTQSFLNALRLGLAAAGGLALVAAVTASLLLAPQLTRPLRQMEAATQSIAAGEFDRRLSVSSGDEIGRLAGSINQMAADLARLQAARRDFIARISHDLRTPLTAIKGSVVNLQDSAPEEMQPTLAMVDEQADRLIRLVSELLALSRLQRGELELRRGPTDLAEIARSAVSLANARAQRLGITLILDMPDELPPIRGDRDRLQQVLVNLLDNAFRATPVGGEVVVRGIGDEEEVILTVLDSGRGLTSEEQSRAFEPYFRGPGGGAGLGLAIAREIVAAHGGRIWLKPRGIPSVGGDVGGAEAGFALPVKQQHPADAGLEASG